MKLKLAKYSKSEFPFIDDSDIDKIISVMYGTVSAMGAVCINRNEEPDDPLINSVYKLPIGTSTIGSAYVKVDDVWKSAVVENVDYNLGLLTVSNGREKSGVTRELKLVNCNGFMFSGNSYPKDVLAHFFENYGNIKYDNSNFAITEFESELSGIEADIGFVLNEEVELWDFVYQLSCSCKKLFRVDYTNDGKITARIKDFERTALSEPIPSCEIVNSSSLPIKTDKTGIYSSVLCRYGKNYVDDVFLSVRDTSYEQDVKQKYKTNKEYECETFLVNSIDASARAFEDATRLADQPLVVEIVVFERQDLRIYDVATISIQPDNLDSRSRQYAGNNDCLVLSINPSLDGLSNNITVLIISGRVPAIQQSAVLSGSFDTIERENSTIEAIQEEIIETVERVGILQMTSPTAPNGTYDEQLGMYEGELYQWTDGGWVKIEAIYPVNPPIIRYDFDSLTISEGEYTKPILDNSGNGNHSVSIIAVTPV